MSAHGNFPKIRFPGMLSAMYGLSSEQTLLRAILRGLQPEGGKGLPPKIAKNKNHQKFLIVRNVEEKRL